MNKRGLVGIEILLIIGVLAIIGGGMVYKLSPQFSPWVSVLPRCTDSDGGINFIEKGKTCEWGNCVEDGCFTPKVLNEFFCGNNSRRVNYKYECETTCSNGRCLEEYQYQCSDQQDNDGDNWADLYDAQCTSPRDKDESVDYVLLAKSSDKVNLGDDIKNVFGVTVDNDDLVRLLEDYEYSNINGNFYVEQKIRLGNLRLEHFRDSDYEWLQNFTRKTPVVGIRFSSGVFVFNYTQEFIYSAESSIVNGRLRDFEKTNLEILDTNYTIIESYLADGSPVFILNESNSKERREIMLKDNQEIRVNGDITYGFIAHIYGYNESEVYYLNKIELEWVSDDDMFITDNSSIKLPAFESIEFLMNGFIPHVEEEMNVLSDGQLSIKLNAFFKDGLAEFNLLYANQTGEFIGIGKDENTKLTTSNNNSLTFSPSKGDKWFVSTWESPINESLAESYLLTINSEDIQENSVSAKNVVTGAYACSDKPIGSTCFIGNVELFVEDVVTEPEKQVKFSINHGSFDEFYTKEGLHVQLPYISNENYSLPGAINFDLNLPGHGFDSFYMFFTEEDKYQNLNSGSSFNMTLDDNSEDELQVGQIDNHGFGGPGGIEDENIGNNVYTTYIKSDLATYIIHYTNDLQDYVKLFYHGEDTYANIYLREASAQCSNELDDDFDGLIDGHDNGCHDAWDESESN
ncbi:hypothetical protein AUJ84_00210 [Candidatus Pacearchaeota archaeon CG1_02_32_132]|nr:MAG: hypothetical protein AUJ84_00210 [Candidatus Pacearchaeota archaeon CG1_02_32_132]